MNSCCVECWCYHPLLMWPSDDIIEAVGFKSGSSTPQRSGSTAGLYRPRLSIDSASPAIDLPQLSSSLPGSLSGSSPLLTPRQGSHTMDFFEMCASLITTLARWDLSSPEPRFNLDVSGVFRLITDLGCRECRRWEWLPLSVSSLSLFQLYCTGRVNRNVESNACHLRLRRHIEEAFFQKGRLIGSFFLFWQNPWVRVVEFKHQASACENWSWAWNLWTRGGQQTSSSLSLLPKIP